MLRHKHGLKVTPSVWYEYLHVVSSVSVSQTAYCVCPISLCPASHQFVMEWSESFARTAQLRMSYWSPMPEAAGQPTGISGGDGAAGGERSHDCGPATSIAHVCEWSLEMSVLYTQRVYVLPARMYALSHSVRMSVKSQHHLGSAWSRIDTIVGGIASQSDGMSGGGEEGDAYGVNGGEGAAGGGGDDGGLFSHILTSLSRQQVCLPHEPPYLQLW